MKKKIIIISVIVAIVLVLCVGGVGGYMYYKEYIEVSEDEEDVNEFAGVEKPIVTMEIEGYGTLKMELYPEMAPNTVKTFVKLINEGFYNGLTFHRVEEGFLIQGGDKEGTGEGATEVSIDGEFKENGYRRNTLKFERGVVGIARQDFAQAAYVTGDESLLKKGYNSGYNQFFIMTEAVASLDGQYTAFGKVTEGMEIVDKISKLETIVEKDKTTGEDVKTSMPKEKPVIKKVTVETFDVNYGEPKTHESFDINKWLSEQQSGT